MPDWFLRSRDTQNAAPPALNIGPRRFLGEMSPFVQIVNFLVTLTSRHRHEFPGRVLI